jgi:colanic acid biosynthesis glycosyl transferase WcaI
MNRPRAQTAAAGSPIVVDAMSPTGAGSARQNRATGTHMRIGVIGLNFHPEQVGIGVYTHDMCRYFVQCGHDVTAIVGFPAYPSSTIRPEYRHRYFMTEQIDGITVKRCHSTVPRDGRSTGRIVQEVSFGVSSALRLAGLTRPSVVIAVLPPFAAACVAAAVCRFRSIPFVIHVQDLQADVAVELGLLSRGPLPAMVSALQKWLFRQAESISTLDERMRDRIRRQGVSGPRITVFPNWVDVDMRPNPRGVDAIRREHGLEGKLVVLYAGSMGVKHGLDLILDLAGVARADRRVQFVLTGDGILRERLAKRVASEGLVNVTLLPIQPIERFRDLVAASDLALIPQRSEVRDLVVPSKPLRLLAAGRAIVAVADSTSGLARLVRESGAGLVLDCADLQAIWNALCLLLEDEGARVQMGDRGRRYAADRFSRDRVLGGYLGELEALVGSWRGGARR